MTGAVRAAMAHLIVAPILLPMLGAGVMIVLAEHRRPLKLVISATSIAIGVLLSLALLVQVDAHGPATYLVGNWPVPFGIALAAAEGSSMASAEARTARSSTGRSSSAAAPALARPRSSAPFTSASR